MGRDAKSAVGAARVATTERDRFWQGHLERIEAAGMEAKAYAEEQGLSVHALYQAKKRLVARGAWAQRVAATSRFSRVRLAEPEAQGSVFRLRLAGGAVLEWSHAPSCEVLGLLLDRVGGGR